MRENKIEVSIVIPCLNEAKTIGVCINKAAKALASYGVAGEIIVADNGSADGSCQIALSSGARVVEVKEKGYGAALMGGFAVAKGKYIIMGDADDSYDFAAIVPFIDKLRQGYDLVIGCRLPKGGGKIMPGAMPWKHRWIGTPILSNIGKLFFKSPVSDFNCGLRGFNLDSYNKLNMRTFGMEFASEMIAKFSMYKMKIVEVPIVLYKDGRGRASHLRSWQDGWRHLRFMLLYSPRWLFLVPGALLFMLGMIGEAFVLLGFGKIGGVVLGTNTALLCSLSILSGFQIILFAVFTKIFAVSEGLLPPDYRLQKINRFINLELGLMAGFLLTLVGFVMVLLVFLTWKNNHFGVISYFESLRITIPAITLAALGIEIIFSSFFLSILGLNRKEASK
jgi:glycosyltransferase involved in cell wall biosynthesis